VKRRPGPDPKVKGPFVWHKHDETDDFFLVIRGRLTIHLRDGDVVLDPGEIFVVRRGVEHCPDAGSRPLVDELLRHPNRFRPGRGRCKAASYARTQSDVA
jgi:hypothetical protein